MAKMKRYAKKIKDQLENNDIARDNEMARPTIYNDVITNKMK